MLHRGEATTSQGHKKDRPSSTAAASPRPWRFAILAALVTWGLANIPLVLVCLEYSDFKTILRLFRLYPGQFLFLLGPFALASLFTWRAWVDALDLYRGFLQNDRRIWRLFRPRRVLLPFALVVGAVVAGGSLLEGPELYGKTDAGPAISKFETYIEEIYEVVDPNTEKPTRPLSFATTMKTKRLKLVQVAELLELATVVFVAWHLFVGVGFLAFARRKAADADNTADANRARKATIWIMLALTTFLAWPPLRMATLHFVEAVDSNFRMAESAGSVIAVYFAILATSMFVLLMFATDKTAKWLLSSAYAVLSTGLVWLFAIRADIIFDSLGSLKGVVNGMAIIIVLVLALGMLLPYVASLLSERKPKPHFREDAEIIADNLSRIAVPDVLDSTRARERVIDSVVLQQRLLMRLLFRAQDEGALAVALPIHRDRGELPSWMELAKFGAREWPGSVSALEDLGNIVMDTSRHEKLELENKSVRHLPEHARGLVIAVARHCFRGE